MILQHNPSAVEVMDKFILDHTRLSPNLQRMRETFVEGDPGAILCIEFYDDVAGRSAAAPRRARRGSRAAAASAIAIHTAIEPAGPGARLEPARSRARAFR